MFYVFLKVKAPGVMGLFEIQLFLELFREKDSAGKKKKIEYVLGQHTHSSSPFSTI